jgi:hypothetical protein
MRLLFITALVIGAAACGGAAPVPLRGTLPQTQSAIRAAEEVGARSVPKAALHLKMAQDQLATAKALEADDEPAQAAVMFSRAEADAELALLLAREASLQAQAQEASKKVEQLKQGQ